MLDFAVVNLETMKETTTKGQSIMKVSQTVRKDGQPVRVYPMNDCYLAFQIAKTVAHKTVQYMANKTQTMIDDSFRRLAGEQNAFLNSHDTTDSELTDYILSKQQSVYMNDGDRDIQGLYSHAQDFFMVALTAVLEGKTMYSNRFDICNHAFLVLNRYIESLRTASEKEVLTAYDLESDEPINTELRRLTKGLTEKEESDGRTAKTSELASAIIETMKDCTDRQKQVIYYLSKGLSVRQTAKNLGVTSRPIQKHKEYIQKKLMKHDVVWDYLTAKEN